MHWNFFQSNVIYSLKILLSNMHKYIIRELEIKSFRCSLWFYSILGIPKIDAKAERNQS